MTSLNLRKSYRENFSARMTFFFVLFFLTIFLSFTAFFVRRELLAMKASFIHEGELLAMVLANNARVEIFSENKAVIEGQVEDVFLRTETKSISVWNVKNELLKWVEKGRRPYRKMPDKEEIQGWKDKFGKLDTVKPSHEEDDHSIRFFSPVYSHPFDQHEEYASLAPRFSIRLMGYVGITMNKRMLNEQMATRLAWATGIGVLLFLVGAWATFLLARKTTKPLNKLTEEVKAMSKWETMKSVPIETEDEIGKLASAFNNLVQCLQKKEAMNRLMEERLQHAQKMEAIGVLTSGIAHDFNNIIQTLIFNSKLLRSRLNRHTVEFGFANEMAISSIKVKSFVNRLLSFSHKHKSEPKPYDLNRIISEVSKFLVILIGKDITLEIKTEKSPQVAFVDYGQMEQVLMNLASNARDSMADGGVITISTMSVAPGFFKDRSNLGKEGADNGYVLLTVKDTGKGMSQETLRHLFDPFYTTKGVGKGTGLGLSLVRGIIERSNGMIEVESEPGQGTAFKIYLPMSREVAVEWIEEDLPRSVGGTEGILIAENDDDVRKAFKATLESNGYKVMEARNGKEAVKKFMKYDKEIHLLLLDIIMPGQNGTEAYEAIKKMKPGIKALFVSGHGEQFLKENFFKSDIPILDKPICPEELLARIREALERGEL